MSYGRCCQRSSGRHYRQPTSATGSSQGERRWMLLSTTRGYIVAIITTTHSFTDFLLYGFGATVSAAVQSLEVAGASASAS